MNHAQSLLLVATGQIEEPFIEIEIEGATQSFEGRDAKVFALGVLTGLKAARDDCEVNLTTNFEET